jgi:endo-1,3-1,4-beta-glycanase ExoK
MDHKSQRQPSRIRNMAPFVKPSVLIRLGSVVAALGFWSSPSFAISGAELIHLPENRYGKFEARIQFAPGNGVVSTFFLWKVGSEEENAFWNELDIEKVGLDCMSYSSNALYGQPGANHSQVLSVPFDLCTSYHTHTFEWTPTTIVWLADGAEVRRLSGADLEAFEANATPGMQVRFNVWVGNSDFGGTLSPDILPVHQYVSWVRYSAYTPGAGDNGTDFSLSWQESFDGPLSDEWVLATWDSPFGNSVHSPANVTVVNGKAVLSLTEDGVPAVVTPPEDPEDVAGPEPVGMGGTPGQGGMPTASGGASQGGSAVAAAGAFGAGGANAFGGNPGDSPVAVGGGAGTVEVPNNGAAGSGQTPPTPTPTPAPGVNPGQPTGAGGTTPTEVIPGNTPGGDSPNAVTPPAANPGAPVAGPVAAGDGSTAAPAPSVANDTSPEAGEEGCACAVGAPNRSGFGWLVLVAAGLLLGRRQANRIVQSNSAP